MNFLAPVLDIAGGLLGGGGSKGAPAGPQKLSQDGNTLRSGTGDTNTGWPKWALIAGGVALLLFGAGFVYLLFRRKP